jgi:hypothetical protein
MLSDMLHIFSLQYASLKIVGLDFLQFITFYLIMAGFCTVSTLHLHMSSACIQITEDLV